MLSTGEILQAVLFFITMVLLTLTILSKRIFRFVNPKYLLTSFSVISLVCIFFIEGVTGHYLLKFYHYAGWNGYVLYLLLFFILISPFILTLFKIAKVIRFKAGYQEKAIAPIPTFENLPEENSFPLLIEDSQIDTTPPVASDKVTED